MDKDSLFELIERFDKSSLSEFKYKTSEDSVVLKKAYAHEVQVSEERRPVSRPETQGNESAAPAIASEAGTEIITAPIVGSFYRSPSPDSPPFTEEGGSIKAGATLCIIEAMKMMNELEADFDMQIVKILVENGTMVEYGAPIFEVKRL